MLARNVKKNNKKKAVPQWSVCGGCSCWEHDGKGRGEAGLAAESVLSAAELRDVHQEECVSLCAFPPPLWWWWLGSGTTGSARFDPVGSPALRWAELREMVVEAEQKKKTLHNNRLWNLSSQTARFFRWMFWFEAISASCGRVWVISRGRVFRMNIEYSSPLAHHQQWTPSHVVRLGYLSNYEHIALNVFSMILWWRELCLR